MIFIKKNNVVNVLCFEISTDFYFVYNIIIIIYI